MAKGVTLNLVAVGRPTFPMALEGIHHPPPGVYIYIYRVYSILFVVLL